MKKLTVSVLIALAVLGLSAVVASNARNTGANNDTSPLLAEGPPRVADSDGPTQAGDIGRAKGNLQPEDEDGDGEKGPFVGIAIETLPAPEAEERGIEGRVLIRRVLDDGPSAGILSTGDIVTAIDGEKVTSAGDIVRRVKAANPGDVLTFTVIRDGESLEVAVTVGARELGIARLHQRVPRFHQRVPRLHQRLLDQVRELGDRFVRAEIVVKTDEGFKTARAVVGTVGEVDAEAGTFVLAPEDGSAQITYAVSDDTLVNLRHKGDLGGLNTQDRTLVVDVDGDVKIVNQGALPPPKPGFAPRDFGKLPEFRGRFRGQLPPGLIERLEGLESDLPEILEERHFKRFPVELWKKKQRQEALRDALTQ